MCPFLYNLFLELMINSCFPIRVVFYVPFSIFYFYLFYHIPLIAFSPPLKAYTHWTSWQFYLTGNGFKVVIFGCFFIFQNIFVLLSKLLDSLPGYKIVG